MTENKNQRAALLPSENVPANTTGIFSGFGRTVIVNPYLSTTLKTETSRIMPSSVCKRLIPDQNIRDTQICGIPDKGIGVCKVINELYNHTSIVNMCSRYV